eukprot:GGOE01006465.1.p2 GENE.GGOE01006465.1~~GGOE01006465.1.p2  ORF type:complete len:378 (-),score=90.22 GGOE01006465.1:929-2029(-)
MPSKEGHRNRWTQVQCASVVPPGRIGHTVTASDTGIVYLWGGVNETLDEGSKYLDDFYRYDSAKREWTQVQLTGDKPYGRAFHSAVLHRGLTYIFGGCYGRGRFNEVCSMNGETGECQLVAASGDVPSTRYCHTAVVHKGDMVVFGGKCGGRNSNKRLADMYAFGLDTGEWRILEASGDIPSSRSAHSAVVYKDRMLMFGGRNADGKCCEDLYEYCFGAGVWTKVDRSPGNQLFMRARHTVVLHNANLVVFAGWSGKKKLNDLFQFNMQDKTFAILHDTDEEDPRLPCRRECHTAVVVQNRMLLFGGRFRGLFMNDNYEFELDAYSLKDFCLQYIAENMRDTDAAKSGLPGDLTLRLEQRLQTAGR